MKRAEFKALSKGIGARLSRIYRAAANRYAPTRSQLEELIEEAGISDPATRQRILDEAVELAGKARAGATRLQLTQLADQRALALVRELQRADSLLGGDEDALLPGEHAEDEAAELDKVAAKVASGLDDAEFAKHEAAEKERARLRELGVRVEG